MKKYILVLQNCALNEPDELCNTGRCIVHKGLSKKKKRPYQQSTVLFTYQKVYEVQPSQIILAKQNTFFNDNHIKYKKDYNNSYIRKKLRRNTTIVQHQKV